MSVVKGPPGNERVYTKSEVAALVARHRPKIEHLSDVHAELTLVHDDLKQLVSHEEDPLKELGALLTGCEKTFVGLKHLLNPTGLPLHMTKDGRVKTQIFHGVSTFLTDIRGFTELTRSVRDRWALPVFDLLSYCYFPYLTEVLESYECHYLNYTGDGLLVLCRDVVDESGRVTMPNVDNAVLCALDLTRVTNGIAEAWRRQGLTRPDGSSHETGLGLSFGDVAVGDPFVPDHAYVGPCKEFDGIFQSILGEAAPDLHPSKKYDHRVRAIHAMSPSINKASRLQDMDKQAPEHTIMMAVEDVERLCPPLRRLFERVGVLALKGMDDAEVWAVRRFAHVDIPALTRDCWEHHRARTTAV